MKSLITTSILIAVFGLSAFSQTQQAPNFFLYQPLTGNKHFRASHFIDMGVKPNNTTGFEYNAVNNNEFIAEIDPFMVFPPEEGEFGGPNAGDQGVVGSIAGVFDVNSLGQATYTLPIILPNDINGLLPSLALSYTSQSSNGLLGVGWNLAAISSISRTGSTVYHDGATKGLYFNSIDNFIIDGQRLIKVSNLPNGTNNCEYRTEQESFNRIFSMQPEFSNYLEGPESFVVYKKDGSKWFYGSTVDSRMHQQISLKTVNYIWLLDRVEDIKGNYIEYKYTKYNNSGEIYIDAIKYTGFQNSNSSVNIYPNYEVKFIYSERNDKEFSFIRDIKKENNKILQQILIKKQPENIAMFTYNMDYVYDGKYYCLHDVSMSDESGNSFNPLRFDWIKPETHPASTETIIQEIDENLLFSGDFNGDGFTDFLQLPKLTSNGYTSNDKIKLMLNNQTGGFVYTSFQRNLSDRFVFIKVCDLDGDLISDFLYCETTIDGYYKITPYISNSNGEFTVLNSIIYLDYLTAASSFSVGDFMGLGKSGLLIKRAWKTGNVTNYAWKMFYYNNNFNNSMDLIGEGNIDNWGSINLEGDFNGDGKTDIMVVNELNTKIYTFDYNEINNLIPVHYYNTNFPTVYHRIFTGDFNGDGRTDLLTYDIDDKEWEISFYKESNFDWPRLTINLPEGDPYQYEENLQYLNQETNISYFILDFDGNGKDDIIAFSYTVPNVNSIFNVGEASFETHMSIAYMFPDKKIVYCSDKFNNQTRFLRKSLQVGDFSGTGKTDLMITKSNQQLLVSIENPGSFGSNFTIVNRTFPTLLKSYDRKQYLISNIFDGMDNTISIEYDKLTSDVVYTNPRYRDFGSGVFDVTIPLNVVKSTITEIATSGNASPVKINFFKYEGLKLHKKGKGILGFTKYINWDNLSNFINVNSNEIDITNIFLFPSSNATYFQSIQNDNLLSYQEFNFSKAVYLESIPKVFMLQLNSHLNHFYEEAGVFRKTELVKYSYDNHNLPGLTQSVYKFGNATSITKSVSQEKLFEHHTNSDFTTDTSFIYNDDPDFINLWLISLVKDTKTTLSSNIEGSDQIINQSTNEYYPESNSMGFPFVSRIIVKPNELENHILSTITTNSNYDLRGNLLSMTISAPNSNPVEQPRSSTIEYSASYHHRFPTATTNALGNTATSTYDPVYGTLKTSTGPNGLTSYYESNPLGTFSKTTSPDGSTTVTVSRWAHGNEHAPVNAMYYTWQQTSGSPEALVFYHKTGAELRSVTFGFDGQPVYIDKIYNSKGLLHKESLPYKNGTTPIYTEYVYDAYNRLKDVITPDNTITTTSYAANEVSVTVVNGNITRTSKKKYNAVGWLVESTDNSGNIVKNEYYCNGNLKKSYISGQPATAIKIKYDDMGNRTLLDDPNYGQIESVYNAYGELVTQTNSRGQTISFSYDKLGRKISETGSAEGDIFWNYSVVQGRIGTLESIVKNNHITNYAYDNLLRLITETETINNVQYATNYTYDELSRPFRTTYPTGVTLQDGYNNYGYHTTVSLENSGKQLWKTEQVNAMGLVTKYRTGNNLETEQSYYPLTSLPYTVKTVKSGNNPIQDLEYKWFGLGNLEYRKKWLNRSNNTSLTESFTYDGLDRLTSVSLNSNILGNYVYDVSKLGNITYNQSDGQTHFSDAIYGAYGYGPHAIAQLTTTNPILTGPRQDIVYNSYDKVSAITEGNHSLQIRYGHHRQRISQQYTDGDNVVEKVWTSACEYITKNGQQYKHTYLSGPLGLFAIHIIYPDGTEEINYIHTDHLGSWHTLTDEAGNLLQELSFDAWGNRRDPATWRSFAGTAPEPLFDRGFTGHEHLYAFNLINMNGRMYDPLIGRMLSPDNYIQAPDFSQSFNRYSYCFNNPLRYTDPTGYWSGWDDLIVGGIGFTFGYVTYGLKTGDWGWKAVGAGAISAGTFLLGYYSGGGTSASSIANTFAASPGAGNGYAATVALGYSGRTVLSGTVSLLMPSVSMPVNDNFQINVSSGVGFGTDGIVGGINISGTYHDRDNSYSLGLGYTPNSASVGIGYGNKDWGLSYYYTRYGNAIGPDGQPNPQSVGGLSFYSGKFSARLENDFLALDGDRWRSNAVELGFFGGKAVIGTTLYNNHMTDGDMIEYGEYEHKNMFGKKYGKWVNGQTYSSPLYVGLRSGNNITRLGYSHRAFQHYPQNIGAHKRGFLGIPFFGHANYFMGYDYFQSGGYGYSGYYNPYSLWGR